MATSLHNLSQYDITTIPDASNMCFGIVVAEWNEEITGALLDGAVKTLEKHGALPENIHIKTVPTVEVSKKTQACYQARVLTYVFWKAPCL